MHCNTFYFKAINNTSLISCQTAIDVKTMLLVLFIHFYRSSDKKGGTKFARPLKISLFIYETFLVSKLILNNHQSIVLFDIIDIISVQVVSVYVHKYIYLQVTQSWINYYSD